MINWRGLRDYLLLRLMERSTWTGLIALATAAGMTIAPQVAEQIAAFGAALAGLVLVLSQERPTVVVKPVVTLVTPNG